MSLTKLDTWDYVSMSVVVALSTIIAFYHVFNVNKSKSNTKEFLVSGKDIGFLPIVLSTVATAISPISMQGFPLEVYTNGIHFILLCIPPFLMLPVYGYLILPVYYNLGVSSIFQYLEYRFSRTLRITASVINTLQLLFYTSCVLYAPSLALNQVTGLDLWSSVISIGVVCILYTAMGGVKAVIWADVIQFIVIFVAVVVVAIKGCIDVGGVTTIWERAMESGRLQFYFLPSPEAKDTVWTYLIGNSFGFLVMMTVSQMFVQRSLSNPSLGKARWSLYWSCIVITIISLLYVATGYVLYARYFDCDPLLNGTVTSRDQYVPLFAVETLSFIRGFSGIYVAGVLCASLSTLSSALNALSAITLSDYIKPLYPKLNDAKEMTISKILAAAYGGLCIAFVAIAANMGGIIRAVFMITGATGGPIFTLFALGVLCPWVSGKAATVGFVAGLAVGLWAGIGSLLSESQIPMAPISVSGCNKSLDSNFTEFVNGNLQQRLVSMNATELSDEPLILTVDPPTEFFLYTLSPIWYGLLTGVVGISVGIASSVILGLQDPEEVDPNLISPPAQRLYQILPEALRTSLGYKSAKVRVKSWAKHMEYENGKEVEDVKIPLQSWHKESNDK